MKPIDTATLLDSAKATGGRVLVVEDHYAEGGLGDAVLNALGGQARVVKLAVREIPRSGPPEALLEKSLPPCIGLRSYSKTLWRPRNLALGSVVRVTWHPSTVKWRRRKRDPPWQRC